MRKFVKQIVHETGNELPAVNEFVTISEAAQLLGLTVARVWRKAKDGHFLGVCSCRCGRSVLIPRDALAHQRSGRKHKSPRDHYEMAS